MKRNALITMLMLSAFHLLYAQEDAGKVQLSDLEVPVSPAFMLLDVGATVIERPGTAKAFALGIVNSVSENGGLPQNYAVEFTPYWFFRHPELSSLKYLGYNASTDRQSIFCNIPKGALSLAMVQSKDSLFSTQNISFGFRTNLITVRRKADIEALKTANKMLVNKLKDQQQRLFSNPDILRLRVDDPALFEQKVREFYAIEELNNVGEKNQIAEVVTRRPLFAVDVAAAINMVFKEEEFSSRKTGRAGVWLTGNYAQPLKSKTQEQENYLNIYVLTRYLNDNMGSKSINSWDAGGKVELEFQRISFAYEYIFRNTEMDNTFRSSGEVRYKLSSSLNVSGAFGRNFGEKRNLIALLGIKWGLNTGNELVLSE